MNNIFQYIFKNLGIDESNNLFESLDDERHVRIKDKSKTICIEEERKNRVTFHTKIKVILVPSAAEYHEAGCDLWWTEQDYQLMRDSFREEIETTLHEDPTLNNNIFLAMSKLYQPKYDPDFGNDLLTSKSSDFKTLSASHDKTNDKSTPMKFGFSPTSLQRKLIFVP
jgi:hypothetical protein